MQLPWMNAAVLSRLRIAAIARRLGVNREPGIPARSTAIYLPPALLENFERFYDLRITVRGSFVAGAVAGFF